MRRYAFATFRAAPLAALVLALGGCAGFDDFLSNTFSYGTNPNAPIGDSENMRRVRGQEVSTEPLLPQSGNVWPGPVQAPPTLQDLEQQTNQGQPPPEATPAAPDHRQPRPSQPPGSSTPPGSVQPGLPAPRNAAPPMVDTTPPGAPSPNGRVVTTPSGSGTITGGAGNFQTLTTPSGQGVIVPNGNGTSTLIRPDGTIETIQTPK
jgi:hypothetical protein